MDKSARFSQQGKQPMMNEQLSRRTMPMRNRPARNGVPERDENHTAVEGTEADEGGDGSARVPGARRPEEVAT
ncbi:hypothetical protein G4G93_20120 [Methylobacterium sp. DB0501]|uniref:hypothetical protein n=1 Tax=Methylobacterium sp. DB0501 TaxID=2709665 RepID=UPI0013EA9FC3|nr:hypothetical protein [Methylobacterium sp. DB0501]NGM36201.1 hypothetical protein [Methylobacterium sp. DB0501]